MKGIGIRNLWFRDQSKTTLLLSQRSRVHTFFTLSNAINRVKSGSSFLMSCLSMANTFVVLGFGPGGERDGGKVTLLFST